MLPFQNATKKRTYDSSIRERCSRENLIVQDWTIALGYLPFSKALGEPIFQRMIRPVTQSIRPLVSAAKSAFLWYNFVSRNRS
jgi:hypothetical protein